MNKIKFDSFKIWHLIILLLVIGNILSFCFGNLGSLIAYIGTLFYFLYHFKKQGIDFNNININIPSFKEILKCLVLSIFIVIFSCASGLLLIFSLLLIFPAIKDYIPTLLESTATTTSSNPIILFISTVILAPIVEEFMFRGVILEKLKIKFNPFIAIFLTSIIFAMIHINPLGIFMLALILSVSYLKTENILIPIIIHAFNNFIAFLPSFLSSSTDQQDIPMEMFSHSNCVSMVGFSVFIILIVGIPLIISLFKNWRIYKIKEENKKSNELTSEL